LIDIVLTRTRAFDRFGSEATFGAQEAADQSDIGFIA
jgi:hypothetical protein